MLHPARLLPTDPARRDIAQALYNSVKDLPIISPHGHTDPSWFSNNERFENPAELLIKPDHYVFRMLYSQGISLEQLGIGATATAPEDVWQLFAEHYYLFRGTPSKVWLDHVFYDVFGIQEPLTKDTAANYYTTIDALLDDEKFLPRALFDRFNIEVLATTESPLDDLLHHDAIQNSSWQGRVITTFRPDPVLDPEYEGFSNNLDRLGQMTGKDTRHYGQYLEALQQRRQDFKDHGATATDHGHPTAYTVNLSRAQAEALFTRVLSDDRTSAEAEMFRGHMLLEMARMSTEDGLVMQLHPGSYRNHNAALFSKFGRDMGADIPMQTEYVHALKPLLDKFGNHPDFTLIVFTLDETSYSRELAPLAGHYPALKLGPAWWFHDSPEGMRRFREQNTETAGFYNTAGFNDDTRAFLSIPARHDMSRRIDAGYIAGLVAEHRLVDSEAFELAQLLAYDLAKDAYKL